MSKKITHKEHRQLLSELYKKQGGKWIYQAGAYIKQQEKQKKLLEVYKELVTTAIATYLEKQVKELENNE